MHSVGFYLLYFLVIGYESPIMVVKMIMFIGRRMSKDIADDIIISCWWLFVIFMTYAFNAAYNIGPEILVNV